MWDKLEDYFLAEPERLMSFGSALVSIGGGIVLFGLGGRVITSATNGIGMIGGHAGAIKTLADIYPSLPTWWIPESIVGAIPAIAITAIGIWLNLTGKRFRRLIGRRR